MWLLFFNLPITWPHKRNQTRHPYVTERSKHVYALFIKCHSRPHLGCLRKGFLSTSIFKEWNLLMAMWPCVSWYLHTFVMEPCLVFYTESAGTSHRLSSERRTSTAAFSIQGSTGACTGTQYCKDLYSAVSVVIYPLILSLTFFMSKTTR